MIPDPTSRRPATWALIPLRGLEDAKTRLGAELDPEERYELVVEMATRTLAAARGAEGLAGTVLVTADPAAARLAEGFGARTIVQRLPGLNAALREARAVALDHGAAAILVLPIDLPAVSATAIEAVLAAAFEHLAPDRPVVLAVPDRHGTGTNLLFVSPPGTIEPAFGEGSFATHRAATEAAGAVFVRLEGPLTLDLDTGADLLAAEAAGAGGRGAA
ncbi:MAG TPA: 2-phospho-L-lactate guanylyltransferase [Candidatus Sulfomarinibacteraceae bacterium]|nr:2-phospho-L-lactate guanylyltransferase [Candidatus Sulfomarinibacteraceae bacterium]